MKITLYSNGCPKCNVIKTKMEIKKIHYVENPHVEEVVRMGFASLPVLKIDEEPLDFLSANQWINEYSSAY